MISIGNSNRDESCISSSTHKQSLDTIALSRNSSLKSNLVKIDSNRSEMFSSTNSKFACNCGLHEVHLNIYNKEFSRKARKSNKVKPNLSDIRDTSDEMSPTSLKVSSVLPQFYFPHVITQVILHTHFCIFSVTAMRNFVKRFALHSQAINAKTVFITTRRCVINGDHQVAIRNIQVVVVQASSSGLVHRWAVKSLLISLFVLVLVR